MNKQQTPVARRDGLVVRKLRDEVLVYDTEQHQAHCLNKNAALIWEHCDGYRTVSELSRLFNTTDDLSEYQREQIVRIALEELAMAHLLEKPIDKPLTTNRVSRRQLMRVAGIAALIAMPAVTSMIAPTAAQASTCLASGQSCTTSAECCSGLCSVGACV